MERYKNAQGHVLAIGSDMPHDGGIATAAEVVAEDARILEASKPKEVTRLQMMDALIAVNEWDAFMAMRATNALLNERWLAALVINRYDPMVLSMGKTGVELDAIFLLASTK